MSVRVKICGITRLEDARHAEACGAHALGFIFWAHSPRAIDPEAAAPLIADLHPYTVKVGVFVDETVPRINRIAAHCRLDRIQLHGGEPFETLAALDRPGYRAFKLGDEAHLDAALAAPDPVLMLDTYDPGRVGGTGRPTNWDWARRLAETRPVILAGGLSPENLADALRAARPAAVDASSALEAAPGRKDPARVERFFKALQHAPHGGQQGSSHDVIAL